MQEIRKYVPTWWFVCLVVMLGLASLAKTYRYYGTLMRGSDAQYYYSLSHSMVFDRDLDVTNNILQTTFTSPFDQDGDGTWESLRRSEVTGKVINRFPAGLSLCEAPFLLLGSGIRSVLTHVGVESTRPPGHSEIEYWTVAIGLLLIFSFGMQRLNEDLKPFVKSPWREISLLAMWLGTSLFFYSNVFPYMAHAVAFTLVVCAVSVLSPHRDPESMNRRLLLFGAILGCLFLVRPQQATIALPLAAYHLYLLRNPLKTWLPGALVGIAALIALITVQAYVNSEAAGVWTLSAYQQEKMVFSWGNPQIYTVLLNPVRGLLWMSPIVAVALMGYLSIKPTRLPMIFVVYAIHAVIQIYVMACWYDPWGGDAFGARMWCGCTPMVACGLALLSMKESPGVNFVTSVLIVLCLIWTNRLLGIYASGRLSQDLSHVDLLQIVF